MFFEYNNKFYDTCKLERKRILLKNFLLKHIEDCPVSLSKSDDYFFSEDSLQLIKISFENVEDFSLENFSF